MPIDIKLPEKPDTHVEQTDPNDERIIKNVTFFGDSAIPEGDPIYNAVYEAAKLLAKNEFRIVNGGGPGLMKAATDGAESVNGHTIAIYWQPKLASFFEGKNLANVADESETQSNYVNRTFGLIEKGDAYVICKGGTGTVSEFGLVWCLAKLYFGVHKPIILYGDFWQELIEAFQKTMYIDEKELAVLYYATTPEELLETIQDHERRLDKSKLKNVVGDEAAFLLKPLVKKTIDTYNQVAQAYHSKHAGKLVAQAQLDEFMSLVNPPAQVLDVGTGPGFDCRYLSEKYSVTGIEPSKKFARIAQFESPNAEIINADVVNLELGENLYKGIWARDSLHHISSENLDLVFKKLYNALVPDGVLYVIVREGEGEISESEHKTYGELHRFYHLFSVSELNERAEKAGFKVEKIDHQQRSHKWINAILRK